MEMRIICIGKLKEKYWQAAAAEYAKRIRGYMNFRIVELKEVRLPKNASPAEEELVIEREGREILSRIQERDYVIPMDMRGKMLSSARMSETITRIYDEGCSSIAFVIGGSLGLSDEVRLRADEIFSFGPMTFPHQLARVMLLEQIYRSFKIANHETYHK